jgi:SPP1 gp7 family putative phage head morphogenesis protein
MPPKQQINKKGLPINYSLDVRQMQRTTQDIAKWRNAMRSAENVLNPNRTQLYELYSDILLDGRLKALIEKRVLNITNSLPRFIEDGKDDDHIIIQEVLQTPWFYDLLQYILEARFWGHSLIEFIPGNNTPIGSAELIARPHVRPEFGDILIKQNNDSERILYRQPPYINNLLEVGKNKDLGLLLEAAQYVIYKRGAFGDWAQYSQLFGMPFRVGKYKAYDDSTRKILEKALAEAGSAAYMVMPEEASIELHKSESGQGNNNVYDLIRRACNEELAILILGQTMTTEDGSSLSQAQVHKNVEDQITLADKIWITYQLNWGFKKILENFGYKVASGRFTFDDIEKLTKDQQIDILVKINNNIAPIDPDYIATTFNVPLLKPAATTPAPNEKKKLTDIEPPTCNHIHAHAYARAHETLSDSVDFSPIDQLFEDLATKVYTQQITKVDIYEPLLLNTVKLLWQAINTGWGKDISLTDFTTNEAQLLTYTKANLFMFSGAKNIEQLRELTDLLTDQDGNIKSFATFKKDAENVFKTYNNTWLKAEYNYAIAASQSAVNWLQYQDAKEVKPLLEYQTAGDDRVRLEHNKLDGIAVPIDDPFWDTYYPPNGWGCRCDVVQRSEDEVKPKKILSKEKAQAKGANVINERDIALFAKNTGKNGSWFDGHFYFEGLTTTEKTDLQTKINKLRYYNEYDQNWIRTALNDNGGYVVTHKKRNLKSNDTADINYIANFLADQGEAIELLPDLPDVKNPDATRNGVVWEFKAVYGNAKYRIQNHIATAKKQNVANVFIYLPNTINKSDVTLGIHNAINLHDNKRKIKLIDILYNNTIYPLTREQIENSNYGDFL